MCLMKMMNMMKMCLLFYCAVFVQTRQQFSVLMSHINSNMHNNFVLCHLMKFTRILVGNTVAAIKLKIDSGIIP